MRLAHPPVTFRHEKLKIEQRIPAAQRYIEEHQFQRALRRGSSFAEVGSRSCRAACSNALMRSLQQLGLADAIKASRALPLLVLNVTFPLVPTES